MRVVFVNVRYFYTLLIIAVCGFICVILWNIHLQPSSKLSKQSRFSNHSDLLLKELKHLINHGSVNSDVIKNLNLSLDSLPSKCNRAYTTSNTNCANETVPYSETSSGFWYPRNCLSRESVAIIIPFRNRVVQLLKLLPALHSLLQTQLRCFRIVVVEQLGSEAFNKGRLNNAGFIEILRSTAYGCVIFHDVDLIPETSATPYECSNRPIHMAPSVEMHNYVLPYSTLVGGVIAFTPRQYIAVNGYSNFYWGWGLEDDDMELRLRHTTNYRRLSSRIGRYRTTRHEKQHIFAVQASRRRVLLDTAVQRRSKDGLNSIKYRLVRLQLKPLYTHLIIDVGSQPVDFEIYV